MTKQAEWQAAIFLFRPDAWPSLWEESGSLDLNPVASTVVVVFFLVLSILLIALLAVLVVVLMRLNAKVEEMTIRVDPLLSRAETLLTETNQRLASIGDKAETILTQGEAVATSVHDKVDRTATAVTRTINAPLISVNSVAAGFSAGWKAFTGPARTRPHSPAFVDVATEPQDWTLAGAEESETLSLQQEVVSDNRARNGMPVTYQTASETKELVEARAGTGS